MFLKQACALQECEVLIVQQQVTAVPLENVEWSLRKSELHLTAAQAAPLLGVGRRPLERLRHSGYLPDISLASIEELAKRPELRGLPVLRMGDPDMDGDRRIGHERADSDEVTREAALGWWGGQVDEVVDAGFLAIAVGGFVVGLLAIHGIQDSRIDPNGYRRVRFDGALVARVEDLIRGTHQLLEPSFGELANAILGNRVPNPPGGPIVLV